MPPSKHGGDGVVGMKGPVIRPASARDADDIGRIAADTDLFPPALAADLLADSLAGAHAAGRWWVADQADRVVGLAWLRPEPLTQSTWNLVALGVHSAARGAGVGRRLLHHVERAATASGASLLLIETSSADAQAPARSLYASAGYRVEARIRDYWEPGDDKIVFWKRVDIGGEASPKPTG